MSKKELLKDLSKLAEKNGMKRILVISDKGIAYENVTNETLNDLMLGVNYVMYGMIGDNKLNVDHIPVIFEEYGRIVQNNIKCSINSEKLKNMTQMIKN